MIRKETEDEALPLWLARRGLVAEFYLRVVRLLWLRFGAGSSRSRKKKREKQVEQAFSVFVSFVLISLWIKLFQKWGRPLNDWNDSCLLLVVLANSFVSRVFFSLSIGAIAAAVRTRTNTTTTHGHIAQTLIHFGNSSSMFKLFSSRTFWLLMIAASSFHCGILFWLFTFTHDGKATWNEYNFLYLNNSRTVNLR